MGQPGLARFNRPGLNAFVPPEEEELGAYRGMPRLDPGLRRAPGDTSELPGATATREVLQELLLPQTPLDVGLMAVGGPFGKAVKTGAVALGGALTATDAEAGAGGGLSKLFSKARELGFSGPWYHGSERTDRLVGKGEIDPRRATSGPMPFFTDSPEIASNYAKSKMDTSLAAVDDGDISKYFTVSPKDLGTGGRTPIPVEQSWHWLPPEVKADILAKAKRVGYENPNEASGPLTLHPPGRDATLSPDHFDYIMRTEARGNPLRALREMWHDSGELVRNETELNNIFRLAGYPHAISETNAPWTQAIGVMPSMLRLQRPLMTEDVEAMTSKVLPTLEEALKRDRTRAAPYGADAWDKNTRYTPRDWVAQAKEDYAKKDNSFVWTSIPDKVTEQVKRLGYDSIIDTGGKMGGQTHRVAVPFSPEQVRSVFAKFDPNKLDSKKLLAGMGGLAAMPAVYDAMNQRAHY